MHAKSHACQSTCDVARFDPGSALDVSLAERFKLARERRGLTLYEVNKRLGHRTTGYSTKIEQGRLKRPSADMIRSLAQILEVSEAWLAHGEGPMDRPSATPEADPYPALTAAASFARLSDDFPDRALLEEVLRDASGRVHHETAEGTGSSDAMLKWLRRLYIVAESRRTPEGQQAEQAEREASAATAASRPRLVDRLPPRTKKTKP